MTGINNKLLSFVSELIKIQWQEIRTSKIKKEQYKFPVQISGGDVGGGDGARHLC